VSKRHPFLAPDWTEPISYIVLGIFIVIPIFLITFLEGPLFFCAVAFACVAGFWILKLFLKHIFSVHITSPVTFSLWLLLSLILGFIIYTCLTEGFHNFFGEETFKGIMALIALIGFWLAMLNGSFEKIKPGRTPASSIFEKKQHEIDDLYQQAFTKNDIKALCQLVKFFNPDYDSFFEKSPKQATEVFEGTQYLGHRVESEGISLLIPEEKLKQYSQQDIDYNYNAALSSNCITLGKMYERGFGCTANTDKALEYFQKAETFYRKAIENVPPKGLKYYQKSLEYIQKEIGKLQN
jgi:hypothetical protein